MAADAGSGEQVSRIEVLKGRVAVSGARRTALVGAGFGTRVAQGKPPVKPRPLLPAPELLAIPDKIEQLNWPLSWQPVRGATGYWVELSDSPGFDSLRWQLRSEANRAPLPNLPDGDYHFRVRAIDDLGLGGHNRRVLIHMDTHPQPPVPLKPHEGAVLRGTVPELQWSASAEADRYRLQIAADEQFQQLLLDQQVDGQHLTPSQLSANGTYYWRLYSIDEQGDQGPVGMPRSWQIKPIPDKPSAELQANDSTLIASWRKGAPGQRYQVQVAEDEDFKSLLIDETSQRATLELEQLKGQVRFLRVRYIEPDGYLGPWGATQRIDPLPDRGWVMILVGALIGLAL